MWISILTQGSDTHMSKNTLKKHAAGAVIAIASAIPAIARAATGTTTDEDPLGLKFAQDIGGGTQDIRTTIAGVIKGFMGLLGMVAVVIILLGGFKWMTAAGSEEKVAEAKKLIISGIIGIFIILSAYAISNFVVGSILNGTN